MCRTIARIRYVELCRKFNSTRTEEDKIRAEAFLDGVAAAYGDGDTSTEHLFDFCQAADTAALRDGYSGACWGMVTPGEPLLTTAPSHYPA